MVADMTTDVRIKPAPGPATDLALPPRLHAVLEAEYPHFSETEMARRRAAVENLLAEFELDHLVYCGANRFGSAVQWLTGWPVTAEAVGVLTSKIPDALFIQHINHVPLACRLAAPAEVAWGGGSSMPPPARRSNAVARARTASA
jgi:Xaa-Pro dipeptidase